MRHSTIKVIPAFYRALHGLDQVRHILPWCAILVKLTPYFSRSRGGNRTHTGLPPAVFETAAYTNSATRPSMLYRGIRTLPPLFTNGMLTITPSAYVRPANRTSCLPLNHSALLQQSLRGSVDKPTVDPMRIELTTISLQGSSASLGTCEPRIPAPESNRSTRICSHLPPIICGGTRNRTSFTPRPRGHS